MNAVKAKRKVTSKKVVARRKRSSRRTAAKPSASKPKIAKAANYCEMPGCDACVVRGVKLGRFHTYNAVLAPPGVGAGRTATLFIGCREFNSASDARAHWQGRTDRPRAKELITKAAAVAKQMRWRWTES